METKEYYGGTYPEPPETEEKTVKIICSFESYITVPSNLDYEEIIEYADNFSKDELIEEADKINIEDIEEI